MPAFRVIYNPGQYEQGALEPRKRLKDDDVAEFIRFWMQGRWALWMGTHFLSQRGVPLSSKMIRSHAKRMQEQGLIPAPSGVIQPHWTDWVRPAGDEPGRVPTVSATGVTWPDAHRYAVKLNRGGRPRKRLQVEPEAPRRQITPDERHSLEEATRADAAAEIAARRQGQPAGLSPEVRAYLLGQDHSDTHSDTHSEETEGQDHEPRHVTDGQGQDPGQEPGASGETTPPGAGGKAPRRRRGARAQANSG